MTCKWEDNSFFGEMKKLVSLHTVSEVSELLSEERLREFVNFGKAHFFPTCTTQIRLSTPILEFSKPFQFLRERGGNLDKSLFVRKKGAICVVYVPFVCSA